MRSATITRKTKETEISVSVLLDGAGIADVETGVGFFDHMLDQVARHSLIDLTVRSKGDLHIDPHHTVEDVGIALGQALAKALGDKRGIVRYADCLLPMDETLTRVALDISGRPFLVFNVGFPSEKIGAFDTQLVREFFQARGRPCRRDPAYRDAIWREQPSYRRIVLQGRRAGAGAAVAIDARQAERVPSTKGAL